MKRIFVKISWAKGKPLFIAAFARGVVTAMTGNTKFPTPAIAAATLTKAASRVEDAYGNRKNGAVARDELENAVVDLDDKLHAQAAYVDGIANGDANIIHSAGFVSTLPAGNRTARTAPVQPPAAPIITAQKGGSIKVTCNTVAGAKIYCFVLVVDGAFDVGINNNQIEVPTGTTAFIINSTKRSTVFNGLPVMKPVQVAVAVINAGGCVAFSPVSIGSTIV